jgi:predicted ATPase
MHSLFNVTFGTPQETTRGAIEMRQQQPGVREAGRVVFRQGQQMLLIFAYLYSHKRSVLLVDEPDAHLEILRQKQVYVLLRDIASENQSQVVMVTHSEVILDEALDNNLTLLMDGKMMTRPQAWNPQQLEALWSGSPCQGARARRVLRGRRHGRRHVARLGAAPDHPLPRNG